MEKIKFNVTMFNRVGNGKKKTDYAGLDNMAESLGAGEFVKIRWTDYFGLKDGKKLSEAINSVNYRLTKNTKSANVFFKSVEELNKGIVYIGNRKAVV
jgi:hypothetical protein